MTSLGTCCVYLIALLFFLQVAASPTCSLRPLGHGKDDTDQVRFLVGVFLSISDSSGPKVEAAIAKCGHFGTTVFEPGDYNITR